MSYSSKFEIKNGKKAVITFRGGAEGSGCYLQMLLPGKGKSVKVKWNRKDMLRLRSPELSEGLPLDVSINGRAPTRLFSKGGRFHESGKSEFWSDPDLKVWGDLFTRMGRGVAALPKMDYDAVVAPESLDGWAGCVSAFSGAGAGIGAAIGGIIGGAVGAGIGAAVGGAVGASFGAGYCTEKELE
jgi:hypothetical protein